MWSHNACKPVIGSGFCLIKLLCSVSGFSFKEGERRFDGLKQLKADPLLLLL